MFNSTYFSYFEHLKSWTFDITNKCISIITALRRCYCFSHSTSHLTFLTSEYLHCSIKKYFCHNQSIIFLPCCVIYFLLLCWSSLLGIATVPYWMQHPPYSDSNLLTLTSQSSYFLSDVCLRRPRGFAPAAVSQQRILSRADWSSFQTSSMSGKSSPSHSDRTHEPWIKYDSFPFCFFLCNPSWFGPGVAESWWSCWI